MFLALETSTKNCSVALANDQGKLLAERREVGEQYIHSEKLHLFIRDVLEEAQLAVRDLRAVAVGRGPGSYTGLRIGTAAVKGLCWAHQLPLYAVSGLDLLAIQVRKEQPSWLADPDWLIPMLDARRQEVYRAIYDAQGHQKAPIAAEVMEANSLEAYRQSGRKIHLLGDGAAKFRSLFSFPDVQFHPERYPEASTLAIFVAGNYKRLTVEDTAYYEPFYLKDFIAKKAKNPLF